MVRQTLGIGLALAVASAAAQATDIYTWVDDNGVVNYSTSVPTQSPAKVFKGDTNGRRSMSAERTGPDQRMLVERIDKLEADLDKERDARFAMLQDQIERDREEVRHLRQEQGRLFGSFGAARSDAQPLVSPATVYYLPVPAYRPHKSKRHAEPPALPERRGYPPLSASPTAAGR